MCRMPVRLHLHERDVCHPFSMPVLNLQTEKSYDCSKVALRSLAKCLHPATCFGTLSGVSQDGV